MTSLYVVVWFHQYEFGQLWDVFSIHLYRLLWSDTFFVVRMFWLFSHLFHHHDDFFSTMVLERRANVEIFGVNFIITYIYRFDLNRSLVNNRRWAWMGLGNARKINLVDDSLHFILLIRRFLLDDEQMFSLFSSSTFNFRFWDLMDSPLARMVEECRDRFGVKYWVKQAWAILFLFLQQRSNEQSERYLYTHTKTSTIIDPPDSPIEFRFSRNDDFFFV